jgi:hypothetical protein
MRNLTVVLMPSDFALTSAGRLHVDRLPDSSCRLTKALVKSSAMMNNQALPEGVFCSGY